ncbi:glutaredoxin-like protein C5orf63 homolog isoform X2 [Amphiura filiformis]|uniref:glutaredoxin-like protein C5orf63 homolog isoform X2 n=1 Tax=Amphiura filiformis TaxID=82378 RepID=UPI003B21B3A4
MASLYGFRCLTHTLRVSRVSSKAMGRTYLGISQTATQQQVRSISTSNHKYCNKGLPSLALFTKEDCSLCDDAKDILRKYDGRFVLDEVYIDKPENKKAFALYRYDIPVFHFNGQYLMKHRVDEELLEGRLQEEEKKA